MVVLVPFDARNPNSRLAAVLDADERREFAGAMLTDVLAALAETDADPTVLSTAPVDCGAPVTVDERPLTEAVNARLADSEGPMAVVMADLVLATPAALERLFDAGGDVAISPGRGGGTNALVVRHPEFRVDYHGASVRDHREAAAAVGASVTEVDSFRLAMDVDDPADLAEVLLHADGRAATWLREAGFAIETGDGRVRASRSER
jgi:2-phospho-L-lactate guanylyltransferase